MKFVSVSIIHKCFFDIFKYEKIPTNADYAAFSTHPRENRCRSHRIFSAGATGGGANWNLPSVEDGCDIRISMPRKTDDPLVSFLRIVLRTLLLRQRTIFPEHLLEGLPAIGNLQTHKELQGQERGRLKGENKKIYADN